MDGMKFSHIEEFYTASLILFLLAMKHHDRVVQGCSIPIYDWSETGRVGTGHLEQVLGGVDRFDVHGGPSRTTYEVKFHFDPDIIVSGTDLLMLIEVKCSTKIEANRLPEYLSFVKAPAHTQSQRWVLLAAPVDWWIESRRRSWAELRRQADAQVKIGWMALEDVVGAIQENVPHEPGLRRYGDA